MEAPIISVRGAVKEYRLGRTVVPALRGVDLDLQRGAFVVVAGPSGSGKTTLLNLIGCVDVPTRGEVVVDGQPTAGLGDRGLTRLRLERLGFVFQSFNLINVLTVQQNIEVPLLLQGRDTQAERERRVRALIDRVGLTAHARHRPAELSGGQRQRVAIARALVARPAVVLADEPTANLDTETGESIIDLMRELNRAEHTTFLFSTHDPEVMRRADEVITLRDGRIVEDAR